tara:strand:+ start:287 stop:550 length:264 start_codon:yes stop_codon:yes gene_type:complete
LDYSSSFGQNLEFSEKHCKNKLIKELDKDQELSLMQFRKKVLKKQTIQISCAKAKLSKIALLMSFLIMKMKKLTHLENTNFPKVEGK